MAISVTPDSLAKSAQSFRKELLIMAVLGLGMSLKHMTLRPGVRYKETVGELSGSSELVPYTGSDTSTSTDLTIKGRELETNLGQCINYFDPNKLVQSIYGSGITSGKGLEGLDINRAVVSKTVMDISKKLNKSLFSGVRNPAGTTTAALFDGFDTIVGKEITAGDIATAKGNLFNWGTDDISATNAVDVLKSIYRAASDELKEEKTKLFIPRSVYDAYLDDYQATVGNMQYNKAFEQVTLEGSSGMCELVPLVGKNGSSYINLTTKANALVGCYQMGDLENVEVRRGNNPFLLQLAMTMFFGVNFETISSERFLVARKTIV